MYFYRITAVLRYYVTNILIIKSIPI